MADTVEETPPPVDAPEQESRSFEVEAAPPAAEADAAPPPAEDDTRNSSSSDDEDEKEKKADPGPAAEAAAAASEVPAKAQGKWNQLLNTIHPVVRKHADKVANHPYVTATASTLRQRAGQAQERVQPIVNHPYVQKGTGAIRAGGAKTLQVSTDRRVLRFLVVTVGLVGLGLLIRVLLLKYPEFGEDLKMKS
jgi:hypothetical protein